MSPNTEVDRKWMLIAVAGLATAPGGASTAGVRSRLRVRIG
jgi:hypothetical protein